MADQQTWPLIGRREEFDSILRARRAGRSAVVSGMAGVGKSRLAREILDHAGASGALTGWVQATRSSARIPLGAFAAILPSEVAAEESFELMRHAIDTLRTRARGRPIVLGVDDAQWLDPTSAALVLLLVTEQIAFVVATLRSDEEHPDAVTAMWKDAGATRIDLDALNQDQTTQLAEAMLSGPLDRRTANWVWTMSQGNALYVRELVRGARSGGVLRETGNLWHLAAPATMTASLTELISARLIGLSPQEQTAVELLAVGEALLFDEFVEAVGEAIAVDLEARGIVSVGASDPAPGEIHLAHPLYGEVLRESIPPLRSRMIRRRLIAIVGGRAHRSRNETLRLARWSLDSETDMDPEFLLHAARAAMEAGDPTLGAELAQLAAPHAAAKAGLLLARSHLLRHEYSAAQAALRHAEGDIRTERDDAVEYLEQQTELQYWALKQPGELRRLLDRASTWWTDDEWSARIGSIRLRLITFENLGRPTDGDDSDATTEHLSGDHTPGEATAAHVGTLLYTGQLGDAQVLAEELNPRPPLRGLDDAITLSLWGRIVLERGIGWTQFSQEMEATFAASAAIEDHAATGQTAYTLACLRICAGRFRDAQTLLTEAQIHLSIHDPVALLPVITATQAEVACFTGSSAEGTLLLEKCRTQLDGAAPLAHQLPYILRAEAWVAYAEGHPERAQRLVLEGATRLSASPVHVARMTYEALRIGASPGPHLPTLAGMKDRCDSRLVDAYAAHASARASRDPRALLAVADEFEDIGATRYAAEASGHAAGLFAQEGRGPSARSAAARSRNLVPPDQDAVAPQIPELDPATLALTPREAQLTRLAAQGLTNAEIADRLVLSVRTVESHLYRAMAKLGITDRRALR